MLAMDEGGRARRVFSLRVRLAAVIGALYVPYLVALCMGHLTSCDSCRAAWVARFAVLPGFAPAQMCHAIVARWFAVQSDAPVLVTAALFTLLAIVVLAWLARLGLAAFIWVVGLTLLVSSIATVLLVQLFAM